MTMYSETYCFWPMRDMDQRFLIFLHYMEIRSTGRHGKHLFWLVFPFFWEYWRLVLFSFGQTSPPHLTYPVDYVSLQGLRASV